MVGEIQDLHFRGFFIDGLGSIPSTDASVSQQTYHINVAPEFDNRCDEMGVMLPL